MLVVLRLIERRSAIPFWPASQTPIASIYIYNNGTGIDFACCQNTLHFARLLLIQISQFWSKSTRIELFCYYIRLCKTWLSSHSQLCFLELLFNANPSMPIIIDVLKKLIAQCLKIWNDLFVQNVEIHIWRSRQNNFRALDRKKHLDCNKYYNRSFHSWG